MVENIRLTAAPALRTTFEPYPVNPYRWHAVVETPEYYQTAEINTWTGDILTDAQRDVIYKPADTPAVEAAKRTPLGQVYLDWGKWAIVRDVGQEPVPALEPPNLPPGRNWTTVEFSDLRFAYSFLSTSGDPRQTPLSGWVYIVDNKDEAGEGMGNNVQK